MDKRQIFAPSIESYGRELVERLEAEIRTGIDNRTGAALIILQVPPDRDIHFQVYTAKPVVGLHGMELLNGEIDHRTAHANEYLVFNADDTRVPRVMTARGLREICTIESEKMSDYVSTLAKALEAFESKKTAADVIQDCSVELAKSDFTDFEDVLNSKDGLKEINENINDNVIDTSTKEAYAKNNLQNDFKERLPGDDGAI